MEAIMGEEPKNDFERAAEQQTDKGLIGEYWYFLRYHKAWWLLPIVIMMLLFGAFLVLSQTAAAPFIYTLF
jgi:hypothetical protein